jgi:hypothetical protein
MTEQTPDPPRTQAALAGLPRYARYAFSWSAVELIAVAVCLALAFNDDQAWTRTAAVIMGVAAISTIAATIVCLRQDALQRSMEGAISYYTAIHAKEDRSHIDELVAKMLRELGGGQAHAGFTERLDEIMERIEERIAERVKQARSEGYVDGVRERLSGEGGAVVSWPREHHS